MVAFERTVKHSISKGGTRLLVSLFVKYCNFLTQHFLWSPSPPLLPPIKPYILLILIETRCEAHLIQKAKNLEPPGINNYDEL